MSQWKTQMLTITLSARSWHFRAADVDQDAGHDDCAASGIAGSVNVHLSTDNCAISLVMGCLGLRNYVGHLVRHHVRAWLILRVPGGSNRRY
jgi:hypothetical protein